MPKPGYISPSRFSDIMTTDRSRKGFGLTALKYADEIILGLLGVELPEVTAKPLEWGKTHEPAARKRYELENFESVPPLESPVFHPDFPFVCGTPDGFIGTDGILEIKCPFNSQNHLDNYRTGMQISDYVWQIQGYMWITGREYAHFVSYDPRFPFHLQYAQRTVERNDLIIEELQSRCVEFWQVVQDRMPK
jgi:hypothetical protein